MHEKSIELLNQAVADEIAAAHQYMYFHFHCDDQGYDLLASLFHQTAIEEMRHIERIAERILFLKGDIEMKAAKEVAKVSAVVDMLRLAQESEQDAIRMYNQFAIQCGNHADSVTKKLFEELIVDEERHFGQFDNESDNMNKFGNSYLALQSIERSKSVLSPASTGG